MGAWQWGAYADVAQQGPGWASGRSAAQEVSGVAVTGVSSWCSSGFRGNLQLIFQSVSPCHSASHNQRQSGETAG